jgi:hypothetical protein
MSCAPSAPSERACELTIEHRAWSNATDERQRGGSVSQPTVSAETVEHIIRARLSEALGGRRGVIEGAVPTIAFTLTYVLSQNLRTSLTISIGLAVVLLAVRVVQRQPVQFVINSLIGIGIAALFASRSGKAADVYLPGIIYNAGYAALMTLSILVRWPVVGLMLGSVTGDVTAWRRDPAIVRLSSRLTWLLVAPCAIRVAVNLPLYVFLEDGQRKVGVMGFTKLAFGWPLQVAALSLMALLLTRGRTPVQLPVDSPDEAARLEAEAARVEAEAAASEG